MADVFISYARTDRQLAERLAVDLEARGFSVWWDHLISSGQEWGREIDHEIARAIAVVQIVTHETERSRIVQSEGRAAREMGKLIPMVFGEARLPLDLNDIQTVRGDDPGAVDQIAQRVRELKNGAPKTRRPDVFRDAPPVGQRPPRFGEVARREFREQSFYWLGVGGAVITLAGNLDAFLKFANWVKWINFHWSEVITWFWNFVIPFDFRILSEDAVIFTLVAVLFANLLLTSSDRDRSIRATITDFIVFATGLVATAYLGFLGFVYELNPAQVGITDRIVGPYIDRMHSIAPPAFDAAISFSMISLCGAAAMLCLYVPIAVIFSIRPNVPNFGARLWRILFGVLLIALANQLTLSVEAQSWGAALTTD